MQKFPMFFSLTLLNLYLASKLKSINKCFYISTSVFAQRLCAIAIMLVNKKTFLKLKPLVNKSETSVHSLVAFYKVHFTFPHEQLVLLLHVHYGTQTVRLISFANPRRIFLWACKCIGFLDSRANFPATGFNRIFCRHKE